MTEHRQFEFTTRGRGLGTGGESLSEADFHDRAERIDRVATLVGPAMPWAFDLLRVARAVYLVDKRFVRATADGWTRTIELSVDVAEPDRWGATQLGDLAALLNMLSGDSWTVRVHGGAVQPQWFDFEARAAEVALFSGGLDSTSYAAQAARRVSGDELLLIGYDDNIRTRQQQILHSIRAIARRPIDFVQVGQRVLRKQGGAKLESSTRTRGLLYMATAVAAASAHRVAQVLVPENGQLAINPPLTHSRLGALSTRSVHPWTIDRMNRLVGSIGGDVEVVNPLQAYTKGEVCGLALEVGLGRADLEGTVSCHDPSSMRFRDGIFNCGYCYPCLVRRAGLLAAAGADDTVYQRELSSLTPKDGIAGNLRALLRWLADDFGLRDLVADAPFPRSVPMPSVLPMLHRSRRELAAMVEQLVSVESPFRYAWSPNLAA